MILKIGPARVTFKPIGTMLIGTKGRVDVEGPLGKERLSLINKRVTTARQLVPVRETSDSPPIEWVWKFITPPPEMKVIELTQEAFFDMILRVANA